jgi:hypothetical protein
VTAFANPRLHPALTPSLSACGNSPLRTASYLPPARVSGVVDPADGSAIGLPQSEVSSRHAQGVLAVHIKMEAARMSTERKIAMAAQIIVSGFTCLADALMLRAAILLSPAAVGALLAPVSKWTAFAGCAVVLLGVAVAA